MKRIRKIIAALLTAALLCGAWGVAETELNLALELPELAEGLAAEDVPEFDGTLELAPEGLEAEITLEENLLTDAAAEANAPTPQANDSASDFLIEDGVLVKYMGPGGNVTIPDGVTSIGDEAFYKCKSLTSVTIPDGVTSIGWKAFYDCNSLTNVTIPDSITFISAYTFYDCDSLTSVTIPDSITFISAYTFYGCSSLTSVTIPASVTSIGEWAFAYCDSLTSVTIPASVTSIGESAFEGCVSLTSVTIPASVTSIGEGAFADCDSLTSVTIPDSVTSIGEWAFAWCDSLTSVTIPDSVTSIGEWAFAGCDSLTSVTIPASVTSIGEGAFKFCDSLTSVTILAKKITIDYDEDDDDAFYGSHPTFHIISDSDAIEWAEDNDYDYDIIKDGLSEKSLSLKSGESHALTAYDYGEKDNAATWSSNNKKVAVVEKGVVTARQAGQCTITAKVSSGRTFKCTVTVTDPAALSETSLVLPLGTFRTLEVTGLGNRKVTWSSSNKKVATVEDGNVTPIRAGKCIISANIEYGKTLKCTVTVYDPAELSETTLRLDMGKTCVLKATGLLKRKVTWASSNTKVATVKSGKIKALKVGKCVISAKLSKTKYLAARTLKCTVTVVDGAALSETAISLKYGDTRNLTVSGLAGRKVTWATSNKKVATVEKGKVKAVGAGTCNIAAQVENGRKLKCKVTVTDPAALSAESMTISTIDSARIKLTGAVKRKVTWSTSDANVVRITKSDAGAAFIRGVRTGEATVTAKVEGGKALKCAVKVVNPLTIKVIDLDEESIYNELDLSFYNNSNKKIVYVRFNVLQYNNRGDRLASPHEYYYLNESIPPHDYWNQYNYWVNDDTKSVKIVITEVTFDDKTTWRP